MFNNCSSLTEIDVSHWNTSSITRLDQMFSECTGLRKLNLREWNIDNSSTYSLLNKCSHLDTLLISSSFAALDTLACTGVGSMDKPCTVIAPDGFDFYADTDSANYFVWCKGYFRLPSSHMMGDVNIDGSVMKVGCQQFINAIRGMVLCGSQNALGYRFAFVHVLAMCRHYDDE